jgi:hypothetical protein
MHPGGTIAAIPISGRTAKHAELVLGVVLMLFVRTVAIGPKSI